MAADWTEKDLVWFVEIPVCVCLDDLQCHHPPFISLISLSYHMITAMRVYVYL